MNVNSQYEILTKKIFETLLKADGVTIDVQHNVEIQGKANKHQIDVYWEYQVAGIKHKVAIECKNYNSKVSIGRVRDFHSVLSDIGNTSGVMVSRKGFQKGAVEFARFYDINLKELRPPENRDWHGRPKTINVAMNLLFPNIVERTINVDEEWFKANVRVSEGEDFQVGISGQSDQLWVIDRDGNRIKNFEQLDSELPPVWDRFKGLRHSYNFEDGYVETHKHGPIRIRSVDYVYDIIVNKERDIVIDASEYARAILKDAISGEIRFFGNGDEL
jgi:hypothetical protein